MEEAAEANNAGPAVATAAVRDAENGAAFLEAVAALGHHHGIDDQRHAGRMLLERRDHGDDHRDRHRHRFDYGDQQRDRGENARQDHLHGLGDDHRAPVVEAVGDDAGAGTNRRVRRFMAGQHELTIGGGVESMSRVGIGASGGAWLLKKPDQIQLDTVLRSHGASTKARSGDRG